MTAEIRSLVDAYSARRASSISRAQSQIERLWRGVDPYDGEAVAEFAERAALVSVATQNLVATLTGLHQNQMFDYGGIQDLDFVPEVPDEVRLFSTRGGSYSKPVTRRTDLGRSERLPVTEVFNRPARKYRYMKSIGASDQDALDESVQRVRIAVETNVILADREAQAQTFQAASKKSRAVIGYRRILHPEKSRGGCCGLCVAAADRIYKASELRPLHDGCWCDSLPVTKANDPGLELNSQDLGALYSVAGSTAGKDLKKLRFTIEDHGELGPYLVSPKGIAVPYYSATAPETLAAAA